jgi:ribosomal protein L40E
MGNIQPAAAPMTLMQQQVPPQTATMQRQVTNVPQGMGDNQPSVSAASVCKVCGAVLNPKMKFCTKCGTVVGTSTPSLLRVKNNEKINIDSKEFIIGKKHEMVNYCVVDNPAISRVHAKIVKHDDGRYFIVDMGSTNHTYVNGTQAPANMEVPINKGAKIRISNEEFIFQ